jgi:PucR family transcriptional regulator, purine catabolism regulatory protein
VSDRGEEQHALTVRELVEDSGLGLRAATGDAGLGRVVRGIHFTDAPDPVPFLQRESVLVITGMSLKDDDQAGGLLLDRLESIQAAALAVATGHYIDTIPETLLTRARELRFPVLEIPHGVLVRTVMSYVYHALASGDLHRLRRTVALQNDLLDLLIADAEVDELLAKVSTLIGMPVLIVDGTGRLMGHAGVAHPVATAARVWRSWTTAAAAAASLGIVEDAEGRFYCREVVLYGKVERLVVAIATQSATSEFADMALAFLQRLVTLHLLRRRDEIVATQRLRQRLLRELVAGTATAEELTGWVADHGVDLREPWRLALCEIGPAGSARRPVGELEDALAEAVDTFLGDRLIPFLSRPGRRSMSILLPNGSMAVGAGSARDLLLVLKGFIAGEPYGVPLTIGVSAAHADPLAGHRALQEATDAAAAAARGVDAHGLVLFEAMSGRFRLLEGQSEEALLDIARRTIAPLIAYDRRRRGQLVTTLRVWLDHHWAIQPTAEALYVHRNTLQKRLRRIETLLGLDLQDPDDIVELYLGLRATQLLGEETVLGRPPADA